MSDSDEEFEPLLKDQTQRTSKSNGYDTVTDKAHQKPSNCRILREAIPGILLLTLSFIFVTMPSTYLPIVLRQEFSISESTSAIIISSSMFAYVISCFVSPRIDFYFDSQQVLIVSYFVFLLSSIAFSYILYLPRHMIPVAGVVCRAIAGFCSGLYENLLSISLLRKFDKNIGSLTAVVDTAINVGTLTGPLVGGTVYKYTGRFVTTNLIPVIPAALVYTCYVFLIYREEERTYQHQIHQSDPTSESEPEYNNLNHDTSNNSNNSSEDKKGSFLKVLGTWQVCLLLFHPFYFSLVNALPITILGPYLLENYGASSVITGIFFMIVSLGYLLGVSFAGVITDIPRFRSSALWLFALTPFVFGLGSLLVGPATFLPIQPSLYVHGTGFAIWGLVFGLGCGPMMRLLLEMWKGLYPNEEADYTAYIMSFFLVTFSLGEATGNAIGGWLYESMSFNHIITYFGLTLFLHGTINTIFIATQYNTVRVGRQTV